MVTSCSSEAVALPADLADAGLAIGGSLEELEVEGLHGLLLGLGPLAPVRGGGHHSGHGGDWVYAGQESHISESCAPHTDLLQEHVSMEDGKMKILKIRANAAPCK